MTTGDKTHLTDEQFTDLLMEQGVAPEVAAHLSACAHCQEEQRMFMATMEDFNGASLAWLGSKQKLDMVPARRRPLQIFRWAPAGVAFAALAVGAIFFAADRHAHSHTDQIAAAQVTSAPADSAAQIASDNQLLQNVAIALSTEDEPLSGYHVAPDPGFTPGHSLESRTK